MLRGLDDKGNFVPVSKAQLKKLQGGGESVKSGKDGKTNEGSASVPKEGPKQEENKTVAAPQPEQTPRQKVMDALKELGVPFARNASLDKLEALYAANSALAAKNGEANL